MASSVIGFASLTFTLATFLRVFWENVQTFFKASYESRMSFGTLRLGLEEGRASLRGLKRHSRSRGSVRQSQDVFHRPELDERDIASLQAAVPRLTKCLEDLQRPFLADELELQVREDHHQRQPGERDDNSKGANRQDREKGRSRHHEEPRSDDVSEIDDPYATVSFVQRWTWLQYRSEATRMLEAVDRLQTRRRARQVGEMACLLQSYKCTLEDIRHGVAITEDRTRRVVGLRRVDRWHHRPACGRQRHCCPCRSCAGECLV